jgi:hypothetical protein
MMAHFTNRARARPARRIDTVMSARQAVAIAGYLHQSEDTIIVRRKTAFCISFAITAAELRCGTSHKEIYDCHEKFWHFASNLLLILFIGPQVSPALTCVKFCPVFSDAQTIAETIR